MGKDYSKVPLGAYLKTYLKNSKIERTEKGIAICKGPSGRNKEDLETKSNSQKDFSTRPLESRRMGKNKEAYIMYVVQGL